jgi:hypothetical protein
MLSGMSHLSAPAESRESAIAVEEQAGKGFGNLPPRGSKSRFEPVDLGDLLVKVVDLKRVVDTITHSTAEIQIVVDIGLYGLDRTTDIAASINQAG